MTESQLQDSTTPQDKGKVEQLSDQAIKERMRPSLPRAIERLKELLESRNEAIAMGAAKIFVNKFIPDLKVTELQGNTERPLGVVILPYLNEQPKNNMATPPGATDGSINKDGV